MCLYLETRHIAVSIECSPSEVYAFVTNPLNLPRWAQGLGSSVENVNGEWLANSPMGRVKIRFAEPNRLGVMDHEVTLESGETFHNPMRVVRNKQGSEVVFTLFRQDTMSDAEWAADAEAIQRDLSALKRLLESSAE